MIPPTCPHKPYRDTIALMDKKILIIEDEPDIREAIAEAMTDAGCQVLTAENGQVGLATALQEHPDLILLDVRMPVMDGQETLKRLRQDSWGRDVKVVMLTAMDDTHNIATAYEGDIIDYIIKGHNSLDEMVKKIREDLYYNK